MSTSTARSGLTRRTLVGGLAATPLLALLAACSSGASSGPRTSAVNLALAPLNSLPVPLPGHPLERLAHLAVLLLHLLRRLAPPEPLRR